MSAFISRWRFYSRKTILIVLIDNQYTDQNILIVKIRNAYPFGQRENMPYQMWLDELKLVKFFLTLGQPYHWYIDWVNQFRSYKDLAGNKKKQNPKHYVNPDQLTLF